MSTDLLRRAARQLRLIAEHNPRGAWTYAPADPRPNFEVLCDGAVVAGLDYGSEDAGLVATITTMLSAVDALADWLNTTADEITKFAGDWAEGTERPGDLTETDDRALALARAILREDR